MQSSTGQDVRIVKTRQFGDLSVEPRHIFRFENGLIGFDDLREFVLVNDEESAPFKWLISVEMPDVGFPLLSPWHVDMNYDLGREYDNRERLIPYVIVTLSKSQPSMTANMKAPVILDVDAQTGKQIIISSDRYSATQVVGTESKTSNEGGKDAGTVA